MSEGLSETSETSVQHMRVCDVFTKERLQRLEPDAPPTLVARTVARILDVCSIRVWFLDRRAITTMDEFYLTFGSDGSIRLRETLYICSKTVRRVNMMLEDAGFDPIPEH